MTVVKREYRRVRSSPQATNAVPVEKRLVGYEDEVARLSLGNEHSVKGVAVWAGQGSGADSSQLTWLML